MQGNHCGSLTAKEFWTNALIGKAMAMVLENLEGILSMNNMPYKATVTGDVCAPVFLYLREIVKKNNERRSTRWYRKVPGLLLL
jgi:hypothetical protein